VAQAPLLFANPPGIHCTPEKGFRGDQIAVRRQQEIKRVPSRIDRAIKISPFPGHPDIRFVDPPRTVRAPHLFAHTPTQNRRLMQNPFAHYEVIDAQPSFGHHLLEISVTQRIPEIPAHAKNDRLAREVSRSEQCRLGVAHLINRPRSPQPVCDTTSERTGGLSRFETRPVLRFRVLHVHQLIARALNTSIFFAGSPAAAGNATSKPPHLRCEAELRRRMRHRHPAQVQGSSVRA